MASTSSSLVRWMIFFTIDIFELSSMLRTKLRSILIESTSNFKDTQTRIPCSKVAMEILNPNFLLFQWFLYCPYQFVKTMFCELKLNGSRLHTIFCTKLLIRIKKSGS